MDRELNDGRVAPVRGGRRGRTRMLGLRDSVSAVAIVAAFVLSGSEISGALANPQGGEVVAGSAAITTPAPAQTQITQSSDKGVINWQSFNIDQHESTVFVQPNASSVTLNRIFDNDPSVISGLLSANGRVILINRNGMVFESGATVNTAGLIAATADIGNDDFMAGRMNFTAAGNPNAQISNAGLITADEGGVVAFVAPSIRNSGVITAKLGRVAMGAGNTFVLDLYGDNLISFPVSAEIAQQLVGPDGRPITSLIDVSGKIDAGAVQLTARAARGLIDNVINIDGEIIASGIRQAGGSVFLTGGEGEGLANSRSVSSSVTETGSGASAPTYGSYGAAIVIDGGANGVAVGGVLNASGAQGGAIQIAGENVKASGTISANGSSGAGGGITIAANNFASLTGSITADGTSAGGSIAVSGGSGQGAGLYTTGTYSATSSEGNGGNVTVGGRNIEFAGAHLDASGATGGGRIAVGYTGDGASRAINADNILASQTSTFTADATGNGDGGSIAFWSNAATDFMGTLSARGGALSGDGGFLEMSSKDQVGFQGTANASAANGEGGQLLLDPKNLIISSSGGSIAGLTNPNQLTFGFQSTNSLTVNPTFITGVLNTGTAVTLQANNDITIASTLTANRFGGDAGNLTLQAGRSVLINASITTDNGDLTIVANETAANGVISAQRDAGAAVITMANGTSINAGNGDVRLTIASGAGNANTTSGTMTLRQINANTIIAQNLGPTAGSGVTLSGTLTASGTGTNNTPLIVASPNGNFVNNAGGNALSVQNGRRWIVYSQNPNANTKGGLNANPYYNTAYNAADPTGLPAAATGNRFAYTLAPVLTVTPNNQSRTYGDPNGAFTFGVSGLVGGDSQAAAVSGAPVLSTTATQTSSVAGGPYAITATLGTLTSNFNYGFTMGAGQLTITTAQLFYLADSKSREYGDPNGTLTGTLSGLKGSDTLVGVASGTMTFTGLADSFADVGTYGIQGGGLTITSGNYKTTILQSASNATALHVTPAQLFYKANVENQAYGHIETGVSGEIAGVKNGESLGDIANGNEFFSTAVTDTFGVGNYAIVGDGLAVFNPNYMPTVLQDPGNATAFKISAAQLFYLASGRTREYGDANPEFDGELTGLIEGDALETVVSGTLTFSTTADQNSHAGLYAITGDGLTVINPNYSLTILQHEDNASALEVTRAQLTYLADNALREYGDANPTFGGQVTGLKNGDLLDAITSGTAVFTSTASLTDGVGTYAINGSGLTVISENYVTTVEQDSNNDAALEIVPAQLSYRADAKSFEYGDTAPAFTGTIQGIKNGESLASVATGAAVWSSDASSTADAGVYRVDGSGLAVINPNYELEIEQAPENTFAIIINQAQLTYVADPKSRLFGFANPALTGQLLGLKNGQAIDEIANGTMTFTTGATIDSLAGLYAINGGGLLISNGNYLPTILQAPSNATALTVHSIPEGVPQTRKEALDKVDSAMDEAQESVASRNNTLHIEGVGTVSDDMVDGNNDELAGQLCVLGAPEGAASAQCNTSKPSK